MPELPEVEAARRAIEEHCIGKMIKRAVIADDPKVIDAVSPTEFEAALVGKTIVASLRKGKNMWLQLDSPPFPSFQFGMAGAIYIKGVAVTKYKRSAVNEVDEWPSKYSKVFIELDDGLELSFTDKRRFAKVRLLENPASVPPICELGPDALLEPMTVDDLYNSLRKKKIGIKALLLDQSFMSGIGNWIADEVLYQARIHPLQIASTLSKENCMVLHKCIMEVIEKAVEVGADSSQFPSNWIFHSREKKPGKAFVDGRKIEFITAGGRTTAYVPDLQTLSGSKVNKTVGTSKKVSTRKNNDVKTQTSKIELESEEEDTDADNEEHFETKTAKRGKTQSGKEKKTVKSGNAPTRKGKNGMDKNDSGDGVKRKARTVQQEKPRGIEVDTASQKRTKVENLGFKTSGIHGPESGSEKDDDTKDQTIKRKAQPKKARTARKLKQAKT